MPLLSPRNGLRASCVVLLLSAAPALSDEANAPLHQRIDQAVAAGNPDFDAQAAPLAADEEFLRRVYLDLTGSVPSAAEARAFLDDKSPDKRPNLIDRLLAGPAHARNMQNVFDVMLMERRPDK